MNRFKLVRDIDETGISGTGAVAEGVMFSDGTACLRWLTRHASTAVYPDIPTLMEIHGHGGKTRCEWVDEPVLTVGTDCRPFDRGRCDMAQDDMENCPFASVGGPASRGDMQRPAWIAAVDAEEYMRGYRHGAWAAYGSEWQTCGFAWAHALTIGAEREAAK